MQEALEQLGARVFLGHEVLEVFMDQGKFSLKIGVEGAVIFKEYDFLVFASGSIAYPQLGEGKKALGMLEKMGHSLSLLYPALVPLKSSMIPKSFAGIRQKASLYAIITHHQKQRMTPILEGDLLFCDYGISGTAVLDLSSYVSKELLGGKQVHVMIDILPHMSIQQCLEGWANVLKRHPHQSLLSILCGCLPKKMAMGFLKLLKLEANTPADLKVLERILAFLKAWKISITQTKGFEYAEVAGGGIALKDCYLDTLESKICPRLFVIGEALEITGHRGGYNLYLALCSAFLASSHIHASLH